METPFPNVPENFEYIWFWFWELIDTGKHVSEGVPESFNHLELRSWVQNMGYLVRPEEMRILIEMSQSWRDEMSIEFESWRAK